MRKGLFAAVLVLTAGSGLALGQPDTPKAAEALPKPTAVLPDYTPSPGVISKSIPQSLPAPSPATVETLPPAACIPDAVVEACPGPGCAKPDWACDYPGCFWVGAEGLLWWTRGSRVPPLVTTATAGGSSLPGALGQPSTLVLVGGTGGVGDDEREGARLTAGFWLDGSHTCGVEGSYFFLGSRSTSFGADTNGALGTGVLTRPFFDVLTGLQNGELVAFPGIAAGGISVRSSSSFQGAELNGVYNICCCTPCGCVPDCAPSCGWFYRLELLGGFRFLDLDEGLGIDETSHVNPALPAGAPFFGGSTINTADQFNTHNQFYGGQIGARGEVRRGWFFVEAMGEIALGVSQESVDIHGATAINSPNGASTVTPAGFLASGSNSGHFSRDPFAVVPEFGLNIGCQFNEHIRAYVGYSFLYWSSVARPGDQIDVGLSGTQIPTDSRYNPQAGPARPAFELRDTSFWAQGISLGMEFRY